MSAAKSDGPNEIGEGSPVEIASPGSSTHLRYRKSGGSTGHGSSGSAKDIDRRKSFGASAITTEPSQNPFKIIALNFMKQYTYIYIYNILKTIYS